MINKIKFLRSISLLTCLLCATAIFAETPFSSLEERMTGAEFTKSGLDKLSPEELSNLNQWISERSVAVYNNATVAATGKGEFSSSDKPGYNQADQDYQNRETIHARIKGPFKGWNDSTVFSLDNGMVWVMDEKDTFYMKTQDNPEITIKPGFLNTWNLSVEGYNSSTKVERIQ
jgi:hypothetical protein